MKKLFFVLFFAFTLTVFSSILTNSDSPFDLSINYENGFIKIINHEILFGTADDGNTPFDFVNQGGQEILFPFERYSVDVKFNHKHNFVFLYQPLTIDTKVPLKEDLKIGNVPIEKNGENDTLNIRYAFPFWRLSYLYNILNTDNLYLSAGLSLQLRNASVIFEKNDGSTITVSQNLGPVPILKLRAKYTFNNNFYIATDSDGFFASSAWINGADFDFEGSVYDLSLRLGGNMTDYLETFLNIRFFGGNAKGISQYETKRWSENSIEDSFYTQNDLSSLIISLGFIVK